MPIRHAVDRELQRVRTTCSGLIGLDEVFQHFRTLESEPYLPQPLDVLLDLSTISSVPDAAQIRSVATEIKRMLEKIRWGNCAIVATRDLVYGVSRILEVRSEDSFLATQVFRELAAAEDWLDSERALRSRAK